MITAAACCVGPSDGRYQQEDGTAENVPHVGPLHANRGAPGGTRVKLSLVRGPAINPVHAQSRRAEEGTCSVDVR